MTGFLDDLSDDSPTDQYASVDDFVVSHLAPLIRRDLEGTVTWCPSWWAHPEAVDRLTALWQAWEHLHRQGAASLSTWWLVHADPHLGFLMDADHGPFAKCYKGHTDRLEPLPLTPRLTR